MTDAGPPAAQPSRGSGRYVWVVSLLILAAVFTRFWHLSERPLHHDESIHAYQSWSLSRGADWRYDPAYHGPFLYYVNALVYKVAGATNFTARVMPAVFGLILIGFAWPLRRWIGNTAAAAYAIFLLTSGHISYFSRFIREDLYSLVFTLGTILAFQRFLETDRAKWLYLAAASFAFAGVTKENAYMTGVLFVGYGVWAYLSDAAESRRRGGSLAAPLKDTARWIWPRLIPLISAELLFLVIWVTMYTGFGKHPGDFFSIDKAVRYWMGQHAIARIPGPWWYYFPQLGYYETAICFAAVAALLSYDFRRDPLVQASLITGAFLAIYTALVLVFARVPALPLRWIAIVGVGALVLSLVLGRTQEQTLSPFYRFIVYWAVGSMAIYGWAREKVPWLTVHPLLPITILASIGAAKLWARRQSLVARAGLAIIGVLLCVNTWGMYLANFRYSAHDVAREPHHAEMLAYVQTSKDLVRNLEAALEKAKPRVPAGQSVIAVAGEAGWPLTWYLRDVQTAWSSRIEAASTPIIISDWDPEGSLDKQLADKYDATRVPIRAWWFPEPRKDGAIQRPTFNDFFRWWLFHEIWSPIGSQDATMFLRKDLAGSGLLQPLTVPIQDTSYRDYGSDAAEIPAGHVTGGSGSGPGQLAEPRGLATDGRGNVYVADTKNSRIAIFDGNGAFVRTLGSKGAGEGQLNEPGGVAIGPDGAVYVADTWNHRVARFGPGGEPLPPWIEPGRAFFGPRAVVFAGGSLYVADTGNKRIVRFDGGGSVIGMWGSAGGDAGQFVEPVGLASDGAGHIYVADTGNHRVQVFDAEGKFVRQFRVLGWKDFYTEPYLAIGPSDSVIVTDSWSGRLAHYDATGNLVRAMKAPGLKRPTGITLDPFGRLIVSDRETNQLFSWSLSDILH
ncbi:MAG: flippase activity-associated protein Agl23 [Acidobacteriota bacterium]